MDNEWIKNQQSRTWSADESLLLSVVVLSLYQLPELSDTVTTLRTTPTTVTKPTTQQPTTTQPPTQSTQATTSSHTPGDQAHFLKLTEIIPSLHKSKS